MTMPTIAILGIDLGKKGSRIATKDHARGWSRSLPRCHLTSLPYMLWRPLPGALLRRPRASRLKHARP